MDGVAGQTDQVCAPNVTREFVAGTARRGCFVPHSGTASEHPEWEPQFVEA